MKPILCTFLLAIVSFLAIGVTRAQRGPLSKAEVLELVRSGMPGRAIVEVVEQDGISFEPTEEILNEFRKSGAKDVVIAAIKKSRRPGPAKPLSENDLLMLLVEDVRSERIIYMVQQRGIAFPPTEENLPKVARERGEG